MIKTRKQVLGAFILIGTLLLSYGIYLNAHTDSYFKWYLVAVVTIIFTLASVLFLMKRRFLFAGIILFMTIGPAIFVNPVSVGLQPILGKEVAQVINKEEQQHPGSKWAVYGNRLLPNFYIAAGARVLDGVKYTPPLEMIKLFDPGKKHEFVWNRYAHIFFDQTKPGHEGIDFELLYPDLYRVYVDPCDPKLRELNVTHLAFDKDPGNEILRCAVPVNTVPISNTWMFRYTRASAR